MARSGTGPNGFNPMLRVLLAAVAVAVVASSAPAQVIYTSPPVIYSRPVVVQSPRPQPAVGLAAVNSPFWFGSDFSIGGPGYMYRGYPPYNGWSSGYRGAYYGEPVPGSFARRGRWSR